MEIFTSANHFQESFLMGDFCNINLSVRPQCNESLFHYSSDDDFVPYFAPNEDEASLLEFFEKEQDLGLPLDTISSDDEEDEIPEEEENTIKPNIVRTRNFYLKEEIGCFAYLKQITIKFKESLSEDVRCFAEDEYGGNNSSFLTWNVNTKANIIRIKFSKPMNLNSFYKISIRWNEYKWESPQLILFSHSACCKKFMVEPLTFKNGRVVIDRNISRIIKTWGLRVGSATLDENNKKIEVHICKNIGHKRNFQLKKTIFNIDKSFAFSSNPFVFLRYDSHTRTSVTYNVISNRNNMTGDDEYTIKVNGVELNFSL